MQTATTAVDVFVERVKSGDWQGMEAHYAPEAVFAATVPQWHFAFRGAGRIVEELEKWFPFTASLNDVHIEPTQRGAAIEFERRWQRPSAVEGQPEMVGVRQMHVLVLEDERIVTHHAHCVGVWDAETFAIIEAEAPRL